MSNRPLFSSTTLAVNSNANRKWDASNVEQGSCSAFSTPCENLSSMKQNSRNHVQEREKGMFTYVISGINLPLPCHRIRGVSIRYQYFNANVLRLYAYEFLTIFSTEINL